MLDSSAQYSSTFFLKAQTNRLTALDGLRGYAAFIVVFFHSILEIKPSLIDAVLKKPLYTLTSSQDLFIKLFLILLNGHAAVALFFVLSGAVLMRSLNQSPETTSFKLLFKFMIQRVFRVYPALIVCLIGVYVLSNALNITFPEIFHDHFSASQFWQNALLWDTALHGASWTLQVEMMAVPFICLGYLLLKITFKKEQGFYIGVLSLLMLLYSLVFLRYHPVGFLCFSFGFLVISPIGAWFFLKIKSSAWLLLLILALSIKHIFPQEEGMFIKGIRWLLQGAFICGVIGFVYHQQKSAVIQWLNHPISQYLGRISYSLYLLNVVGLHALVALAHHYYPAWCDRMPLLMGLGVGCLLSAITLPIAHLSYQYIEKPSIRLGKRLFERSRSNAQAAYDF